MLAFLWPDAAMDLVLREDDVVHRPTIATGYNTIPTADGHMTSSATPAAIARPAPAYGEHTDEVLAGLGLTPAEIAAARDAGVAA